MDEMIGRRFGRLVVLEEVPAYRSKSGGTHRKYKCVCDCGVEKEVLKEHLCSGRQKSCGCLRKENMASFKHGKIDTRLYKIWGNMKNRCSNPNNPSWSDYGGRGISVCEDWQSFEGFMKWAESSGYDDSLTVDRVDNDKGYFPQNCRWVGYTEQSNNRRNNRIVEYQGVRKTVGEWASVTGIPYKTLYGRIASGWDAERAFTQEVRRTASK